MLFGKNIFGGIKKLIICNIYVCLIWEIYGYNMRYEKVFKKFNNINDKVKKIFVFFLGWKNLNK